MHKCIMIKIGSEVNRRKLSKTRKFCVNRDSDHPYHLPAVDWNPLAGSTRVRVPATGYFSSLLWLFANRVNLFVQNNIQ